MNYKCNCTPSPEFRDVVSPGDARLEYIRFGVVSLPAGETLAREAEEKETALIILSGACTVRGEGFAFENLGQRKDVFSGKPASVYLPAGNAYTIEAVTPVEVAVCRVDSDRKGQPAVIACRASFGVPGSPRMARPRFLARARVARPGPSPR